MLFNITSAVLICIKLHTSKLHAQQFASTHRCRAAICVILASCWFTQLVVYYITLDFVRDSEGSLKSKQYVQECSQSESKIFLHPALCVRSGV